MKVKNVQIVKIMKIILKNVNYKIIKNIKNKKDMIYVYMKQIFVLIVIYLILKFVFNVHQNMN